MPDWFQWFSEVHRTARLRAGGPCTANQTAKRTAPKPAPPQADLGGSPLTVTNIFIHAAYSNYKARRGARSHNCGIEGRAEMGLRASLVT